MNILGLDDTGLRTYLKSIGEAPYRSQQILKWLHFVGVDNFAQMTNLSKVLREKLTQLAVIELPEIVHDHTAKDGTRKWLLKLADGNCIETVFIPQKTRGTLCISSQVGCILNCDFCSTGKQGFNRNLSSAEIIAQLWLAVRQLSGTTGQHDHQVTNVVMMGMGEPLLNFDNVVSALKIMLDDHAYGLSKRRVTVSTAGVVPAIYALRAELDVALAISLHAPNDALRTEIVPLNKKYPLAQLLPACKAYFEHDRRRSVTIEYVMLKDVNDTPTHARELIALLSGLKVKINLIPFNPFPNSSYLRSETDTILRFQSILMAADLNTTIRRTRGDDIDAACGQLVGSVQDKTRRKSRYLAKLDQTG